jgi:hypothetical protein
MNTFDVPVGETIQLKVSGYFCGRCGAKADDVTFYAEATDDYSARNPEIQRKWLFYHNPVCDCCPWIWLTDAKIEE